MAALASAIFAGSVLIGTIAASSSALNQSDPKVAAMRAAIACSDRQLEVLAKGTAEPFEEIAFAALDNCHILWQRAATASADDRREEHLSEFSAGFLAAAHARYPDHARPLILRWRAGGPL